MRGRISHTLIAAILAIGIAAGPARAADDLESQLAATTQKFSLEGRRGPSLFQPGFGVGDYSGFAKSVKQQSDVAGIFSSDKAASSLQVERPGMAPVSGECAGGRSRFGLDWITFSRDPLTYICTYTGGPPDAAFELAQSKGGGFLQRLAQPQRAGEFHYGPVILRAQTRYISGIPLSSGGANSYVVTRPDGTPVAGLQTNGLRPTFWLPREQGAERDAAAVLLLTLFTFQDPGR